MGRLPRPLRRLPNARPPLQPDTPHAEIIQAVQDWLRRRAAARHPKKPSAWHLTHKAMVTLTPAPQPGQIVWPADADYRPSRVQTASQPAVPVRGANSGSRRLATVSCCRVRGGGQRPARSLRNLIDSAPCYPKDVILALATKAMDGGWLFELSSRSVAAGSPLVVEANRCLTGVSIQVARVEEHEDIWALTAGLETDPDHANVGRCQAVGGQPPGLYWLTALEITNGPQRATTRVPVQPRLLFEVRAVSDEARSWEELEAAYGEVVRRREKRRDAGIGSGPVAASVLVFVKDLLTTTMLNLVTCEVMPLEPVGWTAEVRAVDRFLEARGAPALPWTEQVLDQVRRAEPATLIQFPVVRADSILQCGDVAMREASLLVMLLAAHRASFGDVFCTIIHEPQTGQLLSGLHIPPYLGNLIGGFISGEEPEGLRRDLYAIRDDTTLQLFVLLLGEAIRERRPDFQYVRLWSLLETVARSRGCPGRPRRDWSGLIQVGKKGQSLFVQEAAEQVYELLRELLAPRGIGEHTFASGLTYGALREQISVWYRRRNCTAHGDPDCVCRDPSKVGAASAKYATCYRARSDDQHGQDGYLRTLREVAKSVVFALLREHWPTQ